MFESLSAGDKEKVGEEWNECVKVAKQAWEAYKNLPTEQDANAAEEKLHLKGAQ
jgi:hypothetical protein